MTELTADQRHALDTHFRAETAPFTFTAPVELADLEHVRGVLAASIPGWTVTVKLVEPFRSLVEVDAFCDGVGYYYRLYMRVR